MTISMRSAAITLLAVSIVGCIIPSALAEGAEAAASSNETSDMAAEGGEHEMSELEIADHLPSEPTDMFLRLDKNVDYKLSAEELNDDGELTTHFPLTDEEMSSGGFMGAMDINKDGNVDENEFLAYVTPRSEALYATNDFMGADKNKNGVLEYTEYKSTGHAAEIVGIAGMTSEGMNPEAETERAFKALDVNSDQKLSKVEYLAVQGKDLFSRKDANGDGQIDEGEFVKYETHHGDMGEEDAVHMFHELDRDKDKLLSRVEDKGDRHDMAGDYDKEDPNEQSAEFQAIDHNEDGAITLGEWQDFQQIHSGGQVTPEQATKEFNAHDFDKDGRVTEAEFMKSK